MSAKSRLRRRWRDLAARHGLTMPIVLTGCHGDRRVEEALLSGLETGHVAFRGDGAVTNFYMLHDDACAAIRGGRCRCRPEVVPHARGEA
jgi:hypothetical protein